MGLKTYPTMAAAEADGCFRASVIAAKIGVDRRQVWTWCVRRHRNGFPNVAGIVLGIDVYKLADVQAWLETYVPSKGGAPKKVLTSPTA